MSLSNPFTCLDPALLFKPQFASPTPPGYRDEPFWIPIKFTVRADGMVYEDFPLAFGTDANAVRGFDDDVPFIAQAIVFPKIGTAVPNTLAAPALIRIRDSFGNPLSKGRVLAGGLLAQSGFQDKNGFGFVFEPEIECAAGGNWLVDFQLSTNSPPASATIGDAAFLVVASIFGTGGNGRSIEFVDPGAPNIPLSVSVIGGAVTVTLATDGASAITSTFLEVAQAIDSSPVALAVLFALWSGGSSLPASAAGPVVLAGGGPSTDVELNGTLLGVKRWKEC